jgi:hypothetical protein
MISPNPFFVSGLKTSTRISCALRYIRPDWEILDKIIAQCGEANIAADAILRRFLELT